jgi:acetolactate synthase-1/2/3 large subunit
MFTLSGGHVFPLYDAAHATGVRIVDVRHEQSAVFAAEAVAKLQRRPASPCSPPARRHQRRSPA